MSIKNHVAFTANSAPVAKAKDFNSFVCLIDADRYKHVVTYRVSQEVLSGTPHSKELVEKYIKEYLEDDIFKKFSAKGYIFCFSAPSKKVFRNHLAQIKKYKGNRDGKVDKNYYPEKFQDMAYVYTYIQARYPVLFDDYLEADDILSFLQDNNTFVFSHDKDLRQVVGYHYNMKFNSLTYTTEDDAVKMIIEQMYTGDTVDNISGLAGIGSKTAGKLMEDKNSMRLVFECLQKYIDKHSFMEGVDTFVEMWGLLSMKMNRGDYFKVKYASFFNLRDSIINS